MEEEKAKSGVPWYYKTWVIVVAFLCVGPLALPLVWWHPKWGVPMKLIVTAAALVITYFLAVATWETLKAVAPYYRELYEALKPR